MTEANSSAPQYEGERWALQVCCDKGLTSTQRLVFLTLATHRNHRTGEAWPSADTLADETALHVSTVREALGAIEATGALGVHRRRGQSTIWAFPLAVDNRGYPSPRTTPTPRPGRATPRPGRQNPSPWATQLPKNTHNPAPDEIADPAIASAWLADMRAALVGDAGALADRLEVERYGAPV